MSKKIEWQERKVRLAQIYNEGLEYAFVSKDYKQITQFFYCKDFLQDNLQTYLNKSKMSLYGFVYDDTFPPVHLKTTRLLISNSKDKTFSSKKDICLDFLHQIETKLRMRKTELYDCENPPSAYKKSGVLFVESSKRWMRSPPMISLYSLLLRVSFVHTVGKTFQETIEAIKDQRLSPYGRDDGDYLRAAWKAIEWLFKFGDRKLFHPRQEDNFPSRVGVLEMHNHCGIVGYAKGSAKNLFPHWYQFV